MKMVEIKCPSCGGKLKVEDSQTKLIICEYCGSQFLLDDEKVQTGLAVARFQRTGSVSVFPICLPFTKVALLRFNVDKVSPPRASLSCVK